jgi:hypothetical protein
MRRLAEFIDAIPIVRLGGLIVCKGEIDELGVAV